MVFTVNVWAIVFLSLQTYIFYSSLWHYKCYTSNSHWWWLVHACTLAAAVTLPPLTQGITQRSHLINEILPDLCVFVKHWAIRLQFGECLNLQRPHQRTNQVSMTGSETVNQSKVQISSGNICLWACITSTSDLDVSKTSNILSSHQKSPQDSRQFVIDPVRLELMSNKPTVAEVSKYPRCQLLDSASQSLGVAKYPLSCNIGPACNVNKSFTRISERISHSRQLKGLELKYIFFHQSIISDSCMLPEMLIWNDQHASLLKKKNLNSPWKKEIHAHTIYCTTIKYIRSNVLVQR